MTLVRRLARPLMSSIFIHGGINALKSAEGHAQMAEPVIDQLQPTVHKATSPLPFDLDNKQVVQVNGAVQIVGGLLLATNRVPRIASLALAGSLVPTTLAGHRFWEETDERTKSMQKIHFFKNLSILGGLLLASVDTEGQPGLAWRAKRRAREAREGIANLDPR